MAQTRTLGSRTVTVTHTPPEIWNDINHPRSVKYDVYSFAVFLWELVTEEEPFKYGKLQYIAVLCTMLLSLCFFCVEHHLT